MELTTEVITQLATGPYKMVTCDICEELFVAEYIGSMDIDEEHDTSVHFDWQTPCPCCKAVKETTMEYV